MLAKRVVPVLLCRGSALVKGVGFAADRRVGSVVAAAKVYAARGVDELFVLAVGRGPPDLATIEAACADAFCPVAVGGGVGSVADAKALLAVGADQVVVGRRDARLLEELADAVGSANVVAAVDDRGDGAVAWAREAERAGAGQLLVQSVARDGTRAGYDLDLVRAVAEEAGVPVVASCGAGCYAHLDEGLEAGAAAVAAGSLWLFTEATPAGAAEYLGARGWTVRRREEVA